MNGMSEDAIRLRFFSFSLSDEAKVWLHSHGLQTDGAEREIKPLCRSLSEVYDWRAAYQLKQMDLIGRIVVQFNISLQSKSHPF